MKYATSNDTLFRSCLLSNCEQTPAMLLVIVRDEMMLGLPFTLIVVLGSLGSFAKTRWNAGWFRESLMEVGGAV